MTEQAADNDVLEAQLVDDWMISRTEQIQSSPLCGFSGSWNGSPSIPKRYDDLEILESSSENNDLANLIANYQLKSKNQLFRSQQPSQNLHSPTGSLSQDVTNGFVCPPLPISRSCYFPPTNLPDGTVIPSSYSNQNLITARSVGNNNPQGGDDYFTMMQPTKSTSSMVYRHPYHSGGYSSARESRESSRGTKLVRDESCAPQSLVMRNPPAVQASVNQRVLPMHYPYPPKSSNVQAQNNHHLLGNNGLREPDRDFTSSHKLISNFNLNPMTASERVLMNNTPYARPSSGGGSWNAIDPVPAGYTKRTFDKGIVDVHDFRPLRVIGKGSYGKVYLVENKHWDHAKRPAIGASIPAPPASEGSIFKDTLTWMSNRNWRGDGANKYMGEAEGCHRLYAMKVLNRETVIKKQQTVHTMTENEVLKFLHHPMIIDMHFAFKTSSKLFMCLEYMSGGELFHHLSEVGIFPEAKAKFYAGCILLALEHMHARGVVYRDLKPENIVMDCTGYIRLTDFGLAKANIRDNHSAKSVCGTPEYLAPEVLMAQGHGLSVDHWGLAALVYEMLTGLPPFYSKKREELLEGIRKGVLTYPETIGPVTKDFLQRLFVKDPKNRLGAHNIEEIKRHPFFRDVDFEGLKNKRVVAPFVPTISNEFDTSNFDREFTHLALEKFTSEDCINPMMEDPFKSSPADHKADIFFDWYYDKRYAPSYFVTPPDLHVGK
eukprot:GHVH01002922.1.p1 GENE.GHVH01002922.1~~GHVH01002922.1.p1  ORF type:complete len:716 (+),score=74.79 GHVH01002922.1:2378-4525(+)